MKALKCEMCGQTDLVKQDGFFVCQFCGTKYTVEEAKKMMIEGTVDVTGSKVKIDHSDELDNLYQIARRAKDDNNAENAAKYYDMILVKDPTSWEASFYVVYYKAMCCKNAEIQRSAILLTNCEKNVLNLVKDYVVDLEEREKAIEEISTKLISIANLLYGAYINFYNNIVIKSQYWAERANIALTIANICYNFGDYVVEIFGDKYAGIAAVPCWKAAISIHNGDMDYFIQSKSKQVELVASYVKKIKRYDPMFRGPVFQAPNEQTPSGKKLFGFEKVLLIIAVIIAAIVITPLLLILLSAIFS